jgi:ATP-dependent RNA helicase RhlE
MPPKIRELAAEILHHPKEIRLKVSKPAEGISQTAYCVYDEQKVPLVCHLMKERKVESVIIFASRKVSVDRIVKAIKAQGLDVRGMHSDRDQTERETIINDFKNKKFPILVATDILSRGIDIEELSHVINYDVPPDPEDYVHRIGRTARADAKGEAITFITEDDMMGFARIERLIEREIPKLPLPGGFKEGPEYNPRFRGRGGRGGGYGGGGGGNRRGGGKPTEIKGHGHAHKHGRGNKPQGGHDQIKGDGRGLPNPKPQTAVNVAPPTHGPAGEGNGGAAKKKKKVRWRKKGGGETPKPNSEG